MSIRPYGENILCKGGVPPPIGENKWELMKKLWLRPKSTGITLL